MTVRDLRHILRRHPEWNDLEIRLEVRDDKGALIGMLEGGYPDTEKTDGVRQYVLWGEWDG